MPANIQTVVVHPLVLLSTVDHYYRVAKVRGERSANLVHAC